MTIAPPRSGSRTLWQRIRDTLVQEIGEGRYPPGTKLPTEAAMSQRFAVNRHTVRRALEALREEGRIHVRRGSGAYVTQGRFDYAIGPRTRLSQNLADQGVASTRTLLRLETVPANPREAENLAIQVGAPVVVNEAVSEADGIPFTYSRGIFPSERLPNLMEWLAEETSITRALARAGVTDYHRRWTRLIAERPGAIIARHLKMPETHPVLYAQGLNADTAGVPVEYGQTWFCSDRVQLVVDRSTFQEEIILPKEEPR